MDRGLSSLGTRLGVAGLDGCARNSLSQPPVTACHSFRAGSRWHFVGSVGLVPPSTSRPFPTIPLRSRCSVRRAGLQEHVVGGCPLSLAETPPALILRDSGNLGHPRLRPGITASSTSKRREHGDSARDSYWTMDRTEYTVYLTKATGGSRPGRRCLKHLHSLRFLSDDCNDHRMGRPEAGPLWG